MSNTRTNQRAKHAIVIGRFQPLHIGHEYLIEQAHSLAEHVTILIGSAGEPRTPKNPWTYDERRLMIQARFPHSDSKPLYDSANDLDWYEQVQEVIETLSRDGEVIIVGHLKDESSFYLKAFPTIKFIEVGFHSVMNSAVMDATRVRDLIFERQMPFVSGVLSASTMTIIGQLLNTPEFENLLKDYEYIKAYKKAWAAAPYAPTFVTADAVVVQSGHVLLVRRAGHPGHGLWALPGGFINQTERIVDAAVRELMEETSIKVQEKILRRCIVANQVFDAPGRSLRGRTITHAFLFKLDDDKALPHVRAADDAAEAWWFSINEIKNMRDCLFEDHWEIIQRMTASL